MMTDQQLYIDGVLMDLSESTSVTLDIKSNLFRDVSKMTSNRTYSIKLPKTVHNMRVLHLSGNPYSEDSFPFVFHKARYCRNGLELISNGRASLLNIGDDIEISIYWGLFPALTTLQSSGLKLNELNINEYLLFSKDNQATKYDEAMASGVFYAKYDTARYISASEDWTNYDTIQGGNNTETYELSDGKIRTGEAAGVNISGNVEEDAAYLCANVSFVAGQVATIDDIISNSEYRAWAILDANGNILYLADDGETPYDISLQAPASAARLVVNALKSLSTGTVLTVTTKTEKSGIMRVSGNGYRGTRSDKGTFQPSVSCERILQQITADTGVQLGWSDEARQIIKSLAIPLVTRKADARTLPGTLAANFAETENLGALSFDVAKAAPQLFEEGTGTRQQLTAAVDCSMTFDVQLLWSWDASQAKPQGYRYWQNEDGTTVREGIYQYPPCYATMKIVSPHTKDQKEDEYTTTYIIGKPADEDSVKNATTIDYSTEMVNGRFIHMITGTGTIDITKGDIITFELKHPKNSRLKGLNCYNGTLNVGAKQSDEVPFGGNYPIGINLPDITVLDFIKFLCLATSSYPLQGIASGVLRFAYIPATLDKSTALDWTKKLIPSGIGNHPRQLDFSVEDYCRHNLYKWKEDDTVSGSYDADMKIKNDTLEYSQDKWTLPFAASDGNRVPIYEWKTETEEVGSGSNKRTITRQVATQYKACKDRIMNVYKDSEGFAALRFGIDLQNVFDNDLTKFRAMVARPRQITERFALSDIDILSIDETKPIYLAQYGCYFVMLGLKTTTKGYCEAQMIKIN